MLPGRFAVLRGVQEIPLHWEGVAGLPRRVANYPYLPGYVTTLNQISSIGSFILGVSTLFLLYNVYWTWRFGKQVTEDDLWGFANSLEWAASCPPPRHNFTHIPRIRSERPAFDLHYPHIRSGRPPAARKPRRAAAGRAAARSGRDKGPSEPPG